MQSQMQVIYAFKTENDIYTYKQDAIRCQ